MQNYETDYFYDPDSKVHGANMDPICGRQDPGESHVGPMNFAIWGVYLIHTPANGSYMYKDLMRSTFPFF